MRPTLQVTWNSSLPYGDNDGAVWAGRGLTVSGSAGVAFLAGPVSIRVAPLAFLSQNAGFPLVPNGDTGRLIYSDPHQGRSIDLPQRFGKGSYGRIDPGQSHVRLSAGGWSIAYSTENMGWGPASHFPFLLGANAGGFPHLKAGTTSARNLWLVRAAGHVFWGTLARSPFFADEGVDPRRYATGAAFVLTPRGLDGVEIGAARFYHVRWPEGGFRRGPHTLVLRGVLKQGLLDQVGDVQLDRDSTNQLASAFARIAIPSAGLEVYGELGREDHSYDLRDFVLLPEHSSSRMAGVRRQWGGASRMSTIVIELIDYRASLSFLRRSSGPTDRVQGSGYTHGRVAEGHTNRGQLLGAPISGGSGAAQWLTYSRHQPDGRWSFHAGRKLLYERGRFPRIDVPEDGLPEAVVETGVSRLLFSRRADVEFQVNAMVFLNRGQGDDANVSLGARVALPRGQMVR